MDLGTGMQGKGGGWSWLRMLNKQFFLTTNPGTCSHHVMARDDLLSTKHDQAISGAVSVYLNSNGGSLSICLLLKSKRSIGLCIFSLMNSLFPIFFFFLPFSGQSFPKTPSDCFCFFPLYEFFFPLSFYADVRKCHTDSSVLNGISVYVWIYVYQTANNHDTWLIYLFMWNRKHAVV